MSEHEEPRPVGHTQAGSRSADLLTDLNSMTATEEIQTIIDLLDVQTKLLHLVRQRDTELAFAWFWFMIAVSALGYVLIGGVA